MVVGGKTPRTWLMHDRAVGELSRVDMLGSLI